MTEIASGCGHVLSADDASRYADLLKSGCLNLYFQPIVSLRSGEVKGIEALGRLSDRGRLILPGIFLQHFGISELRELLFQSLDQGLSALEHCRATHPDLRLSVSVKVVAARVL